MFRSRVFYFFLLSPNLSQGCSTLHSRNERLLATKSQNNQKRSGRNGNVGLSCTEEKNIRRQHSENWTKISSTPEVLNGWLSDLSMEIELDANTTDVIIHTPISKETVCLFSEIRNECGTVSRDVCVLGLSDKLFSTCTLYM